MRLTVHFRLRFVLASCIFLFLYFVLFCHLTAASSPGFCDKDGCAGVIEKGMFKLRNQFFGPQQLSIVKHEMRPAETLTPELQSYTCVLLKLYEILTFDCRQNE